MEIIIYVLTAIVGLCVGSFLNVVIYRVPNNMSVSLPASHCPQCGYVLKWYDNIPVLSYLILGGKCRSCKKHISFRYTLVEIGTMLLWLGCAFFAVSKFPPQQNMTECLLFLAMCCVFCSVLVCVAFIDIEHHLIFDRFQLILLGTGIAATVFDAVVKTSAIWYDHLIGGAVGFVFFYAFYGVFYLIYKQEAMGFGDVKLAGVVGLCLGWKSLIVVILVAAFVGSVVLLLLRIVRKDDKKKEYPFAPFIVLGAIVALFCGEYLIDAYLALCGIA